MKDAANALDEPFAEAIDLHRLWVGMVNEILVCRLADISAWQDVDSGAEKAFATAVERMASARPVAAELGHAQRLKASAHQLARSLIEEMGATGQTRLELYREFVDVHTRFLKRARNLERQLWVNYAHEDALTGALNRKVMDSLLELEWQKAITTGQPCLLAMADIDHFKQVNDVHGHVVGDAVLQATAAVIKESTRHSDMVFRYGGEEFLICMPGLSLAAGKRHIEKMRQQIAANPIGGEVGQMISITVSFGICELAGNRSVADVLKLADKALYRAKAAGRNRVEVG